MRESEIRAEREQVHNRSRTVKVWVSRLLVLVALAVAMADLASWFSSALLAAVALFAAAAASFWEIHLDERREKREAEAGHRDMEMKQLALQLTFQVHELTSHPIEQIGVSVWCVYSPRKKFRGAQRPQVLRRLVRHRISARPGPSNRSWPIGKGVIGKCWESGQEKFQDWTPAQRKHGHRSALSNQQWQRVSPLERWGFEQDEYLDAIKPYSEVLAVPILDPAGAFKGCLSIDIPTPEVPVPPGSPQGTSIGAHSVRSGATLAAQNIGSLMRQELQ